MNQLNLFHNFKMMLTNGTSESEHFSELERTGNGKYEYNVYTRHTY